MKKIFLQPGEIYISSEETIVSTILGSCVSFCIYDEILGVGGITHYQLPRGDNEQLTPNKFAGPSLHNLLKEFKNRYHSSLSDLKVKIIGGSQINTQEGSSFCVGKANIKKAEELVDFYGLNIVGSSLGGIEGRKIEFNTKNGNIRLKSVKSGGAVSNIQSRPKLAKALDTINSDKLLNKEQIIKVLVIDDAPVIQKIFSKIINEQDGFQLVACASDPLEAIEIRKNESVDVITLDVNMPKMDGVTYLKQYMPSDPTPTIMISDYSEEDSGPILDALEHGAFDYLKKPSFDKLDEFTHDFFMKIKEAYNSKINQKKCLKSVVKVTGINLEKILTPEHLLVIGSSTGGTEALKEVLTAMPAVIPTTFIVQHIPPVFSKSFADRLNELCPFKVCEAEDGMYVEPSVVYLAPGGQHMKVEKSGSKLKICITLDPPVNRFRPSVDYLFNSITQLKNKKVVAVIMTGMGNDGAKGMLALRNHGALTLGQDEDSCVVYGMPKEANLLGAVMKEVSLHKLADKICQMFYKLS